MADLTPEEAKQWFGGNTPTGAEVQADYDRYSKDPLAMLWDMLTGNKNTATGRVTSAAGAGIDPIRSGVDAASMAGAMGLARDVRNAPEMDAIFRNGAAGANRANPYNTGIADQSRGAQLALIQQMRAQQAGPSIANMQGQRAMGQMGQQALMQGGRAGMLGAAQGAGGLAGDVGQARLAEIMRSQAGMGGAAGNLRGADLRSADAQMNAMLQQRRMDEASRQFYAGQGMNLRNARDQANVNRETTRLGLVNKANARDLKMGTDFLGYIQNLFGGVATSGGGGSGAPAAHSGTTGEH